jgi:diacylglycerol O-acyltransferase
MCAQSVQLSPVDAAWLHMEDPTNLMMISGVMLLNGHADFERIKEVYRVRLLQFTRFRQRVVESSAPLGMPIGNWTLILILTRMSTILLCPTQVTRPT